MSTHLPPLPLLPLLLANVPTAWRTALAQEGVPQAPFDPLRPGGRFVLYQGPRRPAGLSAGQTAIELSPLPEESPGQPSAARRGWQLGPLLVSEQVARHDHGAIRQQQMRGLRRRIESLAGVWIKIAPFPFPFRSAFNFRLDHDAYIAADFDATLAALAGHEQAVSHYVCGSTHAAHGHALARLRGMDVGGHGYWHHTYHDADENVANMAHGFDVLRAAGLEPAGFAAPHGKYTPGLAAALARLGVTHSSEFGYRYDDWPLWPAGSGTLQLPIHPVCLGAALEAAAGCNLKMPSANVAALVQQHFQQVILARYKAGQPILLYGHPDGRLGRHPDLLRKTLELSQTLPGLWRTSLAGLAGWWQARSEISFQVWAGGSTLRIDAAGLPRQHRAAVEVWRGGRAANVPLADRSTFIAPDQLNYEVRPDDTTPRGQPLPPRETFRQRLLRRIDWEHVTPTHEIAARTWRGWLKRSLRQVRDRAKSPTTTTTESNQHAG
ncbi:MAG: hypothetical protein AB7O62_17205 [Pirellulales bacterium]